MQIITKYFPNLTEHQHQQFVELLKMYPYWNDKINVISRKDICNLEINHILHSLSIAKFISFTDGTSVLDFGTGGGLPALPLAVLFPHVQFHLVDRVGKKLRVAQDIAQNAGINNISIQHGDIKEVKGKYDFVVSRAVMELSQMVPLLQRLIANKSNNAMPNGLITLKGGDLTSEIAPYSAKVIVDELNNYFEEDFFKTKKIVYLPI